MLRPVVALTYPLLTPRLRLEPVTPALAMAARAGHEAFADVLGVHAPSDWVAASLGLVARSASEAWGSEVMPTRVIAIHRDEFEIVGDVRFEPSLRARDEYEIGYGVARSRRRQGYATEATGAIIDWLFAEAAADSIIAGCAKDNLASVNTLRRLGFWLDTNPGTVFWWLLNPELRAQATR